MYLNQRVAELPACPHNVTLFTGQKHDEICGGCDNIIAVKLLMPCKRWLLAAIIAAVNGTAGHAVQVPSF